MPAKAVIRPHHTATTDEHWDSSEAERNLNNDADARTLRREFAWVDADNPESETAAKFPDHDVTVRGKIGAANVPACSNGIGILNGSISRALRHP